MSDLSSESWRQWHSQEIPVRLGVSSCLLGEKVRYDGGHARSQYVSDVMSDWVEWVRVCPENEIGLGTPRPTLRLVHDEGRQRLIAPSTEADHTEAMESFSRQRVASIGELDGFVVKRASPSCGMERIRVYGKSGMPRERNARGLFTKELMEQRPGLPVEEEGRLNDQLLRETFVDRIFCHNRWRNLEAKGLSRARLIEFHTAHKLLLRSHDEVGYQQLGQVVASLGQREDEEVFADYRAKFELTLRNKMTRRKHINVLSHALGYFKRILETREKRQIQTSIGDFSDGLLPLAVPLKLLHFSSIKHDVEYLASQLYFEPHPKQLAMRSAM